jgi:putative ABC transport system substrate-binding protein
VNQNSPRANVEVEQFQKAAQSLGLTVVIAKIGAESDVEGAFAAMARQSVGALLVSNDPGMRRWTSKIAAMTMHHALPAMSGHHSYVAAGVLMSYDASLVDSFRQVGVYVGRVLKGEKPADLPVMQPTRFELTINLKTARTLGLDVPDKLLALADEVIE